MLDKGIHISIKNLTRFKRFLKKQDQYVEKSLQTAVKVEGYRLRKQLKKEIKMGAPGGQPMRPLSYIARRLDRVIKTGGGSTRRQSPNRKPLSRLHMGIKYQIRFKPSFSMKVGWVTPFGRAGGWKQGTWRYLAEKHQKGFSAQISDTLRDQIIDRGATLGTIQGGKTPFFLKKQTQSFKTKPRPILGPFWRGQQHQANRNIRRNFTLKLKGQRI